MGERETIPPLVEPVCVPDIFVSGLADIEEIGGGCFRLTCYTNQRNTMDQTLERVITLRFVVPGDAIPPALLKVAKAVGWRLAGEITGATTRVESRH